MRRWAGKLGGIAAILAALALVGCESRPSHDETDTFDPAVDAPPTNLGAASNLDLTADQARLAKERARAAEATPTGLGPGGKEDATVLEVRAILAKMVEAARTGQTGDLLKHFNPQDAADLQEPLTAISKVPKATDDFAKLAKDRLAVDEMPASLKQAGEQGADKAPSVARLARVAPESLDYKTTGKAVTVAGQGVNMEFVRTGTTWEVKLDAAAKKKIALYGDLAKAIGQFYQTLSDGVQNADITANNLDQKALEQVEKLIAPAAEKYKQLAGEAEKETAAPPADANS